MSAAPSHRKRFALGLLLGLGIGAWLLTLVLNESLSAQSYSAASRRAIVLARSLTQLVEEALKAGVEVQPVVADVAGQNKELKSIRVIKGSRLEASTDPRDTGDKAAPRRLAREEKPIYDRGQRLRAAVLTNQEEGAGRKSEIEVAQLPTGDFGVAAPIEMDGAVVGFAELMVAPVKKDGAKGSVLMVAGIVIPFLLFLLVAKIVGENRKVVAMAAFALLLASLVLYAWHVNNVISSVRRAQEKDLLTLVQQQTTRAQQSFQKLGLQLSEAPDASTWDVDVFRKTRGFVTKDAKTNTAALESEISRVRTDSRNIALGILALGLGLLAFFGFGAASRIWRTLVRYREAYMYTAPAMVGMMVLVFFPFLYGIALSFTGATLYNSDKSILEVWNGIRNYIDIMGDFSIVRRTDTGLVFNYQNFYWTLLFTIIWTVTNVSIGVTVGLVLALILNTKGLALRPLYRVLLIFPWAMPNYITALIWKGMFHQQFGVINQVLQIFGADPVSWFQRPTTSFLTALATNGWLSFPFMMVVSLGALQSIPSDLYEAARVDGASRWQQFKSITLPSLRPALVPAIILSVVWTFNMFNIIFLVTQGEPGGATEILITQAYKIAFEKYRYGYAAAYSTVIFLILLIYGTFQNRITKATEAVA